METFLVAKDVQVKFYEIPMESHSPHQMIWYYNTKSKSLKTGMYRLSSDHRNVYYHAHLSCVKQKFPSFNPGQHVRVNIDTFVKLTQ
ncbi:MAG: hypothetical protein MJE68_16555, partial [Proteobacteria bacterium]|nr:hypothetical protein [Pseudomonadota bacterium]